jgi:hypothetical protein
MGQQIRHASTRSRSSPASTFGETLSQPKSPA